MDTKNVTKFFLFIIFSGFSFASFSQNINIKGTVTDSKKKQALSYCSIVLLNTSIGTQTDDAGNFSLSIPKEQDATELVISYIGYKTDTLQLTPLLTEYNIALNPIQNSLEEITVTEFSKTAEAQRNPVSIKYVDAKKIEQSTESNIIDVLAKNVPGLNAIKTGPNVSKPYIRGLGYNRVVTLYDGIPIEGQQFEDEEVLSVDMYNIDNAEITLGPNSLIYGPEALAGVINLIPATPNDSDKTVHGRFLSEYHGNNGLIGNSLRLNYGSKEWSFVGRGSYRIAKNFSNKIDGKVFNTGFREINASGAITHKSKNGYSSLNFSIYNNAQEIPDGSRDSLSRKFTKAIFDDPEDDLEARPIVSDEELNSYSLSPIYQRIIHYRVYSKNQYYFKDQGNISAIFCFQQNQRKEYDFPQQKELLGVSMKLNSYNYDFNYVVHKFSNTEISAGLSGAFQTNKNVDAHDIPISDYKLFDIGSYLMSKWTHKKWTISGGARFDTRFVKGKDFYTKEDSTTELLSQVFTPDTAGAELLFPAFRKTYVGVSSNFGTSYRISKNIVLKLNISQGFRPPHVSEFASNGLDGSAHSYFIGKEDLKSEFNWQFDMGASFIFKDVSASFNVFNNYVKNYIYLVQLVDDNGDPVELIEGNKTFQYQQNNADLVGLESTIEIHPKVMKGFNFISNFSLIYGFNLQSDYKHKGVNGAYLPSIPPMRLLSAVSQDVYIKSKVFPMINFRIEGEFNAAQNRYLALNETETKTPAYFLLNAGVNFTFKYSKKSTLQLQFQVNNILNKAYQSNLSRLKYAEYYSESPDGHLGIFGMGRNITVKLILPF